MFYGAEPLPADEMNIQKATGQVLYFCLLAGFLASVVTWVPTTALALDAEPVTPRKGRGSDLYMLNYNRFIENGFYIGATGRAAFYRKGWGIQGGARAAFLVDHIFAIGGACEVSLYQSSGSIRPDRYYAINTGSPGAIRTLYGGAYLAYHIFHDRIVNFSLGAIAGLGRLGGDYLKGSGTRYYFVEPEIWIFVNLPRYARIGIGTSYRHTWGVDYMGIGDGDFRGFSAGLQVQAGIL